MTQFNNLGELMGATAQKLAGKPINIRMQPPATKGMTGETHQGEDGSLYVDITPGLDDKTLLLVYCHELSHCRLHQFKRSNVHTAKPQSLGTGGRTINYSKREDEADLQTESWIEWANKHRDKNLTYFEGCLWALYHKEN